MLTSHLHDSARHRRLAPRLGVVIGLMVCTFSGSEPAVALDQQASAPLGRLFMTPEERRALDADRTPWRDPDTPEAPVAANNGRVVLNGVLKRSAGPDVVWINGQPAGGKHGTVQVQRGPDLQNRVTVIDAADGRRVTLKPGQSWTP